MQASSVVARAPWPNPARVDPGNCNGCRRCFADCPYGAISMQPHPDARIGAELAVVDPALCAACGICAGACPSSTPFRSMRDLVTGIDMPQLPIDALRERLREELDAIPAARRIVVFGCNYGADVDGLRGADTAVVGLLCAGQLPPSFIEYALRNGAQAVVISACAQDGCTYRLGERWTRERVRSEREPGLRAHVPRNAVHIVHGARRDRAAIANEVARVRARLVASTPDIGAVRD